ncbi:MAG TPA: zf-HC2 domain-containing protein [Mycobacteriales bacterium]|nr:zf-HC2 domain-containing protein [Mycobacteriales bacterium]
MTFPDGHLADEAIAAFVDDGLSASARQRADRHVKCCLECRAVVAAQREAQVLLAAAPDPELPPGLLARLRDIPMTADLGGSDFVLVADEQGLAWASAPPPAADPRLTVATEPAPAPAPALVSAGTGSPGDAAPAAARRPGRGTAGPGRARPRSYPSVRSSRPPRRGRRRLAGALAGLAFGVIASAASTAAPNSAAPVGQLNTTGGTIPVVNRSGNSGPLELNTLRVGPERQQSDLLPASRRGR